MVSNALSKPLYILSRERKLYGKESTKQSNQKTPSIPHSQSNQNQKTLTTKGKS